YNGNNNKIATSDTLYADANGAIDISVIKQAGIYAYINCMKIEVFENKNGKVYNLKNTGFETGSLEGWIKEAKSANSIAVVNEDLTSQNVHSLKLGGDNVSVSQQISYAGGLKEYVLSGYFYAPAVLGSRQAAYLTLSYYDQSNHFLASSKSDSITSKSTAEAITKLLTNLRIPAGTAYVTVAINWVNPNNSAGVIYFDNLSLNPPLVDNLKLTYMGSSVPWGQGATNQQGYTYLYTQLLNARKLTGGKDWTTTNISVPGNNTTAVLNRYTSDLLPQKSRYVVFALSLGNEGIHERGQPSFDSFKTNMQKLITKARADGMIPVITNCYTRNDFNATDYNYTRQMNALINTWNVPSINLLGAVDDLTGKYTTGYWDDALHPNNLGHAEMSYTMVPSLFDALDDNKPLPVKVAGSYVTFTKSSTATKTIDIVPENIVHPFTVAISFKASSSGLLLQVKDTTGVGVIGIVDGKLVYSSAKGGVIKGVTKVDDGQWHKLILTHYYAKGVTIMYCDSIAQGYATEKLITRRVKLGGSNVPKTVQFKDLLFYRSGMNSDEVKNISRDSLLKSSLEIYTPLDEKKFSVQDPLVNLAQSTNKVWLVTELKNAAIPNSIIKYSSGSGGKNTTMSFTTANT
ncbi:MAG: hypothetical protein EOP47_25805, partial [Sphingobacteriaceae bacterium]